MNNDWEIVENEFSYVEADGKIFKYENENPEDDIIVNNILEAEIIIPEYNNKHIMNLITTSCSLANISLSLLKSNTLILDIFKSCNF